MSHYEYKAFITYSHADEKVAAWLQRKLETYRLPRKLDAAGADHRRVGRIFRDRLELAAGSSLSDEINRALADSEFLIVVCSPAARQSRWVDLEIREFLAHHDSSRILCCIVDGEPGAIDNPDRAALECFPRALGYTEQDSQPGPAAEPIAADCRASGDGRRMARLKLISGLLGTGLDQLVRRDAQRRQRSLFAIATASAVGMVAFAVLALVAIDARTNEQFRRAEAEDLIEFMLSDLRDRLDAVGRLDVLDAVGEKAVEYYSRMDLPEISEESLGRRARAFHLLGEVDDLAGDLESAHTAFEEAFRSTGELLSRSPRDGERIFNHAQSVFWVGYLNWQLGDTESAEAAFSEYLELALRLRRDFPERHAWAAEAGHANINLGVLAFDNGDNEQARIRFAAARDIFASVATDEPDNRDWLQLKAQSHAWLADVLERSGELEQAIANRQAELDIYETLLAADADDQMTKTFMIVTRQALAGLALLRGDTALATDNLQQATELGRTLSELDPENTRVAFMTGSALSDLGLVMIRQGNYTAASDALTEARAYTGLLLGQESDVIDWQRLDLDVRLRQLELAATAGEPIAVAPSVQSILAELAAHRDTNPGYLWVLSLMAKARDLLADALRNAGDAAAADRQLRLIVEELSDRSDELPLPALEILARALAGSGEAGRASELIDRLRTSGYHFENPP